MRMKKNILSLALLLVMCGLIIAPTLVLAQTDHLNTVAPFQNNQAMSGGGNGLWTMTSMLTIFITIVQWVYTIFFIVAVFFFLLAAYNFVLGGSDEKRIETAKSQLKWGVVGIVVALLSVGVSYAVDTFLRNGV